MTARDKLMKNICHVRFLFLAAIFVFVIFYFQLSSYLKRTAALQRAAVEFLANLPTNITTNPTIDENVCRCSRKSNFRTVVASPSTCGGSATGRGKGQKVISFSLYGNNNTENSNYYLNGVRENLERIGEVYPGWVVRVYHSFDTSDVYWQNQFCDLWCEFPNLDFCSVGRLPEPYGDVSKKHGMVWRFLVMGDPLVERFLIRDLDSVPLDREKEAVNEWIASKKQYHFMRDHPEHNIYILGGMWGGSNENLAQSKRILRDMLTDAEGIFVKGFDQELLVKHLWPEVKSNSLSHDSYFCSSYPGLILPFPTRRKDNLYVGGPVFASFVNATCPEECRPPRHKDWIYC